MPIIMKNSCVSGGSGAEPQISAFKLGPMFLRIAGNMAEFASERHSESAKVPSPLRRRKYSRLARVQTFNSAGSFVRSVESDSTLLRASAVSRTIHDPAKQNGK